MTDEEKAEEYAKVRIKVFDKDSSYYFFHVKRAYLDGLAEGKPKWHDLRKDPNDLPKDDGEYLVAYRNYQLPEEIVTEVLEWKDCRFVDENYECIPWFDCKDVLVAWCELPKFEE